MMADWKVRFLPVVGEKDLDSLDQSIRIRIFKAIRKLRRDPYRGDPLGKKQEIDLTNFYKYEVDGYRIVYYIVEKEVFILLVAVGKREREYVYKTAAERIKSLRKKTAEELAKLSDLWNK